MCLLNPGRTGDIRVEYSVYSTQTEVQTPNSML